MEEIARHKKALISLRTQEAPPDPKAIQKSLRALLKAVNDMIAFSSKEDQPHVIDEIESFLVFYLDCFKILNKTRNRLPWLTELNLQALSAFWKKLELPSQKSRVEIYLGIVTLFHEGIQSERKLKQKRGDDASVIQALALYKRALNIAPPPEPEPEPVFPPAVAPPPVVAVAPEPERKRVRVVKPVKARASEATPPVPKFDQFAPPEKKRADIGILMGMKKYREAVKICKNIFDCVSSDYRCAGECYYQIGTEYFGEKKFQEAIEGYKDALLQCKYIEKTDVTDEDQGAIAKVFTALVKALGESSESMANFLDFYLDHFDKFYWDGKKLPGLDEITIDDRQITDKSSKEITRIYRAIIAMFSQDAKLEEDSLVSLIGEFEITKESWSDDALVSAAFDLFQRALTLVRSTKYRELLNPELQAVQPEQKRRKEIGDSSSSSSLPSYLPPFGLEVRPAMAMPLPKEPQRTYSKK